MSKKKSRRSASASRRRQTVSSQSVKETPVEKASGPIDFRTEYHYVLTDLRRFGILAVSMFATLIVLALIIR